MQRWATTLAGLAVVVLAVALVVHSLQSSKTAEHDSISADAGPASAEDARVAVASEAGTPSTSGGTLLLSDLVGAESSPFEGGVGGTLLDGAPVPPLPASAPRQVRFGVILVSYGDAQASAAGGHGPGRSRAEAKALALKLLATAQQDFHAAVQQGDAGSSDDVGRVKLGILEPAPEYVLFTLPAGGVGGPVDTPRGYWIVKRLD